MTVSASGGPVSNISLGSGITVGGAGAVKVTGVPAGTSGFALAQNQSRTFVYTVAGVKPGTAVLNAAVSGTGADGSGVSTTATKSFPVAQKALKITMAADPGKVQLEADNDGKLAPKTIKVRVKLANTTKVRLTGVQLLSLSPLPADRTQQLDKLAFPRKALPVKFGNIEGGANKVKTFTLKVTGDGTYVIDALALYADPSQSGGNGRAFAEGGKFTVEAPLLYFKASTRNKFVVDGDSWFVTGHVKNLSSFQTLCLLPLYPRWEGNAGGLGPHDIRSTPVDDVAPPLAGPVKPGENVPFLMRVQTEFDGGTTSAVELHPRAAKGDPGDACRVVDAQQRPALRGAHMKVAKDSTQFQVRIDKYRSKLGGPGALEFFGAYAHGAYTTLAHLYESSISLAHEYGSVAKLRAALGRGASAVLSQLYHAAAVTAWFYLESTEAERRQFFDQIKADFANKTHEVWDGVQAGVQQSVGKWLENVADAYTAGDWQRLFHVLGESAGSGLTETAISMAEWEIGLGLLKKTGAVARTITRYAATESGFITSLKTIKAGRILKFAEMQRLWGLAIEDYEAFKTIAEEEGVLIGVRSRAPISVTNLDEGAVWKHEELKPKNVSDIDVRYLGFDPADKGLVAFRTYTLKQRQAIADRILNLKGVSKAERAAIADRAATRFGEHEYVRKIEGLAEKQQIDVGFNYADNGVNKASTSKVRAFALEKDHLSSGATYFRPLQENPALDALASNKGKLPKWCKALLEKVLCRVTGDMDGVYLTDPQGRALSEAKRIAVYNRLQEVGWQHPETLTWIKDALFDFDKKNKILKGLELGGEAMMEFAPDGVVRATYLSLKASNLAAGLHDYFVAVLGGYTSFAESATVR